MTGMRETALTEININDVDFVHGTVKVIDKRHKTHVYKMNKAKREALEDWIADREEKLADQKIDALFISNQKKRVSVKCVVSIVKRYSLEGLGYSISPHKLRAAFCTILYNDTRDVEFVRRAVGHTCIETTLRYIADDDSAREEAAERLERIFG